VPPSMLLEDLGEGGSAMGRSRRLRGLGALALLTIVLAACAPSGVDHVEYAVHHDNVGELVASADAVVVGRVAQTSRGRILDQEDVVYTIMNVEVAVDQTWAGRMPTSAFTIERFGWEQVARRPGWRGWFDFAGERVWRVEGELRLEDGDRGVFFLAGESGSPGWSVLGPEGLYLVDGEVLADTGRADPTVRRVESMSVAELERAVAEAAAAVRRGELQPKRPPGG
jgi:hypothetical protein